MSQQGAMGEIPMTPPPHVKMESVTPGLPLDQGSLTPTPLSRLMENGDSSAAATTFKGPTLTPSKNSVAIESWSDCKPQIRRQPVLKLRRLEPRHIRRKLDVMKLGITSECAKRVRKELQRAIRNSRRRIRRKMGLCKPSRKKLAPGEVKPPRRRLANGGPQGKRKRGTWATVANGAVADPDAMQIKSEPLREPLRLKISLHDNKRVIRGIDRGGLPAMAPPQTFTPTALHQLDHLPQLTSAPHHQVQPYATSFPLTHHNMTKASHMEGPAPPPQHLTPMGLPHPAIFHPQGHPHHPVAVDKSQMEAWNQNSNLHHHEKYRVPTTSTLPYPPTLIPRRELPQHPGATLLARKRARMPPTDSSPPPSWLVMDNTQMVLQPSEVAVMEEPSVIIPKPPPLVPFPRDVPTLQDSRKYHHSSQDPRKVFQRAPDHGFHEKVVLYRAHDPNAVVRNDLPRGPKPLHSHPYQDTSSDPKASHGSQQEQSRRMMAVKTEAADPSPTCTSPASPMVFIPASIAQTICDTPSAVHQDPRPLNLSVSTLHQPPTTQPMATAVIHHTPSAPRVISTAGKVSSQLVWILGTHPSSASPSTSVPQSTSAVQSGTSSLQASTSLSQPGTSISQPNTSTLLPYPATSQPNTSPHPAPPAHPSHTRSGPEDQQAVSSVQLPVPVSPTPPTATSVVKEPRSVVASSAFSSYSNLLPSPGGQLVPASSSSSSLPSRKPQVTTTTTTTTITTKVTTSPIMSTVPIMTNHNDRPTTEVRRPLKRPYLASPKCKKVRFTEYMESESSESDEEQEGRVRKRIKMQENSEDDHTSQSHSPPFQKDREASHRSQIRTSSIIAATSSASATREPATRTTLPPNNTMEEAAVSGGGRARVDYVPVISKVTTPTTNHEGAVLATSRVENMPGISPSNFTPPLAESPNLLRKVNDRENSQQIISRAIPKKRFLMMVEPLKTLTNGTPTPFQRQPGEERQRADDGDRWARSSIIHSTAKTLSEKAAEEETRDTPLPAATHGLSEKEYSVPGNQLTTTAMLTTPPTTTTTTTTATIAAATSTTAPVHSSTAETDSVKSLVKVPQHLPDPLHPSQILTERRKLVVRVERLVYESITDVFLATHRLTNSCGRRLRRHLKLLRPPEPGPLWQPVKKRRRKRQVKEVPAPDPAPPASPLAPHTLEGREDEGVINVNKRRLVVFRNRRLRPFQLKFLCQLGLSLAKRAARSSTLDVLGATGTSMDPRFFGIRGTKQPARNQTPVMGEMGQRIQGTLALETPGQCHPPVSLPQGGNIHNLQMKQYPGLLGHPPPLAPPPGRLHNRSVVPAPGTAVVQAMDHRQGARIVMVDHHGQMHRAYTQAIPRNFSRYHTPSSRAESWTAAPQVARDAAAPPLMFMGPNPREQIQPGVRAPPQRAMPPPLSFMGHTTEAAPRAVPQHGYAQPAASSSWHPQVELPHRGFPVINHTKYVLAEKNPHHLYHNPPPQHPPPPPYTPRQTHKVLYTASNATTTHAQSPTSLQYVMVQQRGHTTHDRPHLAYYPVTPAWSSKPHPRDPHHKAAPVAAHHPLHPPRAMQVSTGQHYETQPSTSTSDSNQPMDLGPPATSTTAATSSATTTREHHCQKTCLPEVMAVVEALVLQLVDAGLPTSPYSIIHTLTQLLLARPGAPNSAPFCCPAQEQKWYREFRATHAQRLQEQKGSEQEAGAGVAQRLAKDEVRAWLARLKMDMMKFYGVPPQRIFYMQELNFFLDQQTREIKYHRMFPGPATPAPGGKDTVTVLLTLGADGQVGPGMIIFPRMVIPERLFESLHTVAGGRDWVLGSSANGWLTGDCVLEFVSDVFVPWLRRRGVHFPAALFTSERVSGIPLASSSDNFMAQGIQLITVPRDVSVVLSPAEWLVGEHLRQCWGRTVREWSDANDSKPLLEENFAPFIIKCLTARAAPHLVADKFAKFGIFPFNPQAMFHFLLNHHTRHSLLTHRSRHL